MIRKVIILLYATTVVGLSAGSTYAQKGGEFTRSEFEMETCQADQPATESTTVSMRAMSYLPTT